MFVAASSPALFTASRKSGKAMLGTIIAGWRSVRSTERPASDPTWVGRGERPRVAAAALKSRPRPARARRSPARPRPPRGGGRSSRGRRRRGWARAAAGWRRAGSRRRARGRDRLDARLPDLGLELGRRALGDDLALVDDPDPFRQLVGLLQVLGGEEDGDAIVAGQPRD